jgi:nanoRNase/pAp phosphatase (c-di-AMP/oligoRNAs hydrolase)
MINQKLMLKIVDRLKSAPGLIVLHHNADIDAVASAIALHNAFPNHSVGEKNYSHILKILRYYFHLNLIFPKI